MTEQKITLRIRCKLHQKTGNLAAFSDDLPGLLVVGANEQEITDKLPGAITELFHAMGRPTAQVKLVVGIDSEWDAPSFRAEVSQQV